LHPITAADRFRQFLGIGVLIVEKDYYIVQQIALLIKYPVVHDRVFRYQVVQALADITTIGLYLLGATD